MPSRSLFHHTHHMSEDLKHLENSAGIARINTDPFISHRNPQVLEELARWVRDSLVGRVDASDDRRILSEYEGTNVATVVASPTDFGLTDGVASPPDGLARRSSVESIDLN